MIWILALLGVYAAFNWPAVWLLLRGFFWFCLMLLCLVLLLMVLAWLWCIDEGLKRLQDFICSQAEVLE